MQNLRYLVGIVMVFKVLKNYQIFLDINLKRQYKMSDMSARQ
jgi:hypothetical protein